MKWIGKLFSCGRSTIPLNSEDKHKRGSARMVSDITQAGESPCVSHYTGNCSRLFGTTIVVRKKRGEKLGLRLFPNSVNVHSIEVDSVLYRHRFEIPSGSRICLVENTVVSESNIREILRECVKSTSVSITFGSGESQRATSIQLNRPTVARLESSHVTPRSGSAMSDTGNSVVPRVSVDLGMVPIDFSKLSRDSIQMWTRKPARNSSLPDPRSSCWADDEEHHRMSSLSKRSSCEGVYHNNPREEDMGRID